MKKKINKEENKENSIKETIKNIKKKTELKSLDNSFIEKKIKNYLNKNIKISLKLKNSKTKQFFKSKEFRIMKKEIRKELREIYGVFDVESKNRDKLLKENNIKKLLTTHQSTKERLPYYTKIYRELFNIIQPKKILDIGCGINPISYSLMRISPEYFCCDISSKDMDFLNRFFKKNNIKGLAFSADAVNDKMKLLKKISEIKPDTIFMFKLLDTLETIKRHYTKKLIPKLMNKTDTIVVSFATKSIGGDKTIPEHKRKWFENFLEKEKLNWNINTIIIPNEIFYIIEKKIIEKKK